MKKGIIFIIALFLLSSAILISCSTGSSSGITPTSEKGWLCDYDRVGAIPLYTAPYIKAGKSFKTTCIGCCVDVNMTSMKESDGIIFYYVNAGGATGWVKGDYYYPDWSGKPSWSNN